MIATCYCVHCEKALEVEAEYLGQCGPCAHCQRTTPLNTPLEKRESRDGLLPLIIFLVVVIGIIAIGYFGSASAVSVVILVVADLSVYFLPSAVGRKKRNSHAIFALNIFLGWTFVGWVVALVWALTEDKN